METIARYAFNADRNEWIGVIARDDGLILTVGCERTEADIANWCKRALSGDDNDMYDRVTNVPKCNNL